MEAEEQLETRAGRLRQQETEGTVFMILCLSEPPGQHHSKESGWQGHHPGGPEHNSRTLKPNGICPPRLFTSFAKVTFFFLPICPFAMGMCVRGLSHQCILEVGDMSALTGSQPDRDLSQADSSLKSQPSQP